MKKDFDWALWGLIAMWGIGGMLSIAASAGVLYFIFVAADYLMHY